MEWVMQTSKETRGTRDSVGVDEGQGKDDGKVVQAPLFTVNARGELGQPMADVPALEATSSLEIARWWFRHHLEQLKRPINTIDSYMYDLALFQQSVGSKAIDKIGASD